MDKFGIFNLISSLVNQNSTLKNPLEQQQKGDPTPLGDLLNSLINTNSTPTKNKTSPESPKNKPYLSPPLSSQMLSTMTSHDQFINRVKSRHKKT
ncbi:MAG: hypothetical protein IJC07_02880 [Clostridia bacterium]|nr:hypothetical protein [Clostridia bacterium]